MNSDNVRDSDDRGVVLILVAVAMLAILAITAMAIDLGSMRADRRDDQTVADLASLAAGSFLAGNGSATVVSNPFLACKGALSSAQANAPAFSPTQNADACGVFPADADDPITGCSGTTTPANVVFSDARYVLTIRYPIPGSELADARFTGDVGANDGSDQCDRMRVTFAQTRSTSFARFLGVNQQTTQASSVIRGTTSSTSLEVAALLLLERHGCNALQVSGASQGGGIVVQNFEDTPGIIVADSAGSTANPGGCSTNNNASGFVIYGTAAPSGGETITAEDSSTRPGVIGAYSLSVGGRGVCCFPGGITPDGQAASISSRQHADNRYNAADNGFGITNLHSDGRAATTMTAATAAAAGYTVISDTVLTPNACSGAVLPASLLATRVFVDCPSGFSTGNNDLIFPLATDLIFTDKVDVPGGGALRLPLAERIYVRGCTTAPGNCGGGNNFAVKVAGIFQVRADPVDPDCPEGSTAGSAVLATFSGPFLVPGGSVALCSTTVYLGKNAASYVRQASESGGNCTAVLPCPVDTGGDSYFSVTGGGASVEWSGPNEGSEPADSSRPFEDLALWTESSSPSRIGGQGSNRSAGVFFQPNSDVNFTGQASQSQPLNAQFFSRRLDLSGQGKLNLLPNPADAVPTPVPGLYSLIR